MASAGGRSGGDGEEWARVVQAARERLAGRQTEILADYGVDTGATRYRWDLDAAEVVFTPESGPEVVARLHLVGAVADSSGTWLWSWANDAVPEASSGRMLEVRRYGEEHGYDWLTEPEWPAEHAVGYDLAAVAADVIGADGFFHDHHHDLALFFVLTDFRRGGQPPPSMDR